MDNDGESRGIMQSTLFTLVWFSLIEFGRAEPSSDGN